MKRLAAVWSGAFVLLAASGGGASAQLENLHTQRAEGGRWCMADHFHSGSSSGQSTRAAAEREAISNWASFTALEYGSHWANGRIAGSRKMDCSNSAGSWGCQSEARPCRAFQAGDRRR